MSNEIHQASVPSNTTPLKDLPSMSTTLFEAKARKGLTFDEIAKAIGRDEVWVAAAFYGQAKLEPEDIEKISGVLDLPQGQLQSALGAHWWPYRGLGQTPPQDPVIYRLYEGVLVYGHAIKAVIHEKFGDGIMSMIDCKINIEKKPDPKGDRVLLTFDRSAPSPSTSLCTTTHHSPAISFLARFFGNTASPVAMSAAKIKAQQIIDDNAVAVFSKSYCPHCKATKALLTELGAKYYTIELDTADDGAAIQDALEGLSGQRSVPNIFIQQKHIGGNSDLQAKKSELPGLLKAAGAI
ncbi:hypothetical protein HWV62_4818 [Athelia sp. TMB]|nr:hypothetical protein HWV62_4818 [Athelia sp. TMB]